VLHGGEKMSKSKGNTVTPHEYGPETTRLFVLSAAHPNRDFEWTATSVDGAYEFQQTVHRMVEGFAGREDVREILDVVDIDAPESIELVVAQDWKYTAYGRAREVDPEDSLVDAVLGSDGVPRSEAAASFVADLDERRPGLEPVVDGEREHELLEAAAWLLEDEFDASVTVRRAEDGDDLADRARPNRPAIYVS